MSYLPREFKGVPVVWAAERPFGELLTRIAPAGSTVAEIIAATPRLPPAFATRGIAVIDGIEVPRQYWHLVRPRCDRGPVVVQLGIELLGGGGGKSKLKTAAMVALLVAAVAIGQFQVLGALGTLTIGSASVTGASLLGAGLATAALAIGAISPPPTFDAMGTAPAPGAQQNSAALTGNVLAAGASIPQVIGDGMRVYPPLVAPVLVERVGLDQYAEAVYALTGPHKLWSPRLGSADASQIDDVEVELFEALPDSPDFSLINRQAYTQAVGAELVRHRVKADNQIQLFDQQVPGNSLPSWSAVASRLSPDEIWITLGCEGLADWNEAGVAQAAPMRVRFRRRGSLSWINGPEFHIASATGAAVEFVVKLIFGAPPLTRPPAPVSNGVYLAYKTAPGQTQSPATGGWQADAYFGAVAGGDLYSSTTFDSTNVRNIGLYEDRVELYLDPAVFPKDAYEVQLLQGLTYKWSSFTPSSYSYSGTIYDFFSYYNSGGVAALARTRASLRDKMTIGRVDSIWNVPPVNGRDLALMGVRVKNQNLGQFSIMAAAYVPTWDGITWSGRAVTSSPADHFRNALLSELNKRNVPAGLVGDDVLAAWRTLCIARGYKINAVLQDRNLLEVLDVIAPCGYARRRHAGKIDVMVDYLRAAESPIMVFTPRNMSDFSWQKPLGDLPDGFRVRFFDEDNDFKQNTVIVLRPGAVDTGRYQQVNNDGRTDLAGVIERAIFDLRQLTARMTFYSGKTNLKHLSCRRGSLVGLQHDTLVRQAGWARISQAISSGGILAGFILDQSVPTPSEDMWSNVAAMWSNYNSMWSAPRFGMAIERRDGSVSVHEIALDPGGESNVVLLKNAIMDPGRDLIDADCMIATGPLARVQKRVLVQNIEPAEDFTAAMTFVDEAPELFNADGSIALN